MEPQKLLIQTTVRTEWVFCGCSWIRIYLKKFKRKCVVPMSGSRNGAHGEEFDGGYKIKSVKYNGKDVKYTITDTRMQIDLPEELKSNGGVAKIKIEYSFLSPKYGSDRMGIQDTKNGKIFHDGSMVSENVCMMMF
jgi:hypothetical protein